MDIGFYLDPDTGLPHISPDEEPEGVFVVTAYELTGKAKRAYRRRRRRKPR